MDPETNLPDLTSDLEDTIDDLEDALSPLLSTPLPTQTSTLPTLDRAKLHILTAYSLESLLFQALQASGGNAKAHPVFAELARLKTYFGKVKAAEAAGEGKRVGGEPTTRLDKDAAARFIRHGLSGNEKFDREREERVAKEKARAALKARLIGAKVNKKFDDEAETKVQEELGRKRKAEAVEQEESSEEEGLTVLEEPEPATKVDAVGSEEDHVDSENADFYGEAQDEMDLDSSAPATSDPAPSRSSRRTSKDKKDKKSSKRRKSEKASDSDPPTRRSRSSKKEPPTQREPEMIIPERGAAPKSRSETFNALLSGTFAEGKKQKKKSSSKAKKA